MIPSDLLPWVEGYEEEELHGRHYFSSTPFPNEESMPQPTTPAHFAGLPQSFDAMIQSRYMKKEDVETPKLLTIKSFTYENAGDEKNPDMKWAMHFMEFDKPLILNSTNLQLLKLALGVSGPNDALGKKIVAFNDPSVSYGGKLVGGVRLRAPKGRAAAPAPPPPQPTHVTDPDFEDDIPF
jgi:hypothetical protein